MKEQTKFVALGDSFTEGVGDIDLRLPNNCRGWADRVAEELARADDRTRYANLAIRGRRLQRIIDEQIEPALAMRPTLVSFYAGGNDLLMARLNMAQLMRDYEHAVRRLKASGATLLLFTGYNVPLSPLLEPLKVRTAIYNRNIRRIAAKYQTLLVDYWCFEKFQDPRMWAPDRLHMASPGHSYMAKKVLEVLGAPHSLQSPALAAPLQRSLAKNIVDDVTWLKRDVGPWFSRRLRGVSSGDHLGARWPEPMPVVLPERLGTARAREDQLSSRFS
ncbi:SGNH/GDSL hydrolase family protein [Paenarthrobacter sp. CAP02]|uniref:SGNH/GDSL hydrolase family protein n=1 Tax=Paenarthrobacter sp. CAP02 TaxID=3158144 RepID=UPI0032DBB72F